MRSRIQGQRKYEAEDMPQAWRQSLRKMRSLPLSGAAQGAATMKRLSVGEETFALHCQAYRLQPEREHRFDEARKWRFDFAFPDMKLGIEIEGGMWTNGRHTRGSGYEADLKKYNAAAKKGWVVLRYSTGMVTTGEAIREVAEILERGL
jgi:very-short-patch-repair endonuclease